MVVSPVDREVDDDGRVLVWAKRTPAVASNAPRGAPHLDRVFGERDATILLLEAARLGRFAEGASRIVFGVRGPPSVLRALGPPFELFRFSKGDAAICDSTHGVGD